MIIQSKAVIDQGQGKRIRRRFFSLWQEIKFVKSYVYQVDRNFYPINKSTLFIDISQKFVEKRNENKNYFSLTKIKDISISEFYKSNEIRMQI